MTVLEVVLGLGWSISVIYGVLYFLLYDYERKRIIGNLERETKLLREKYVY